jgi:hypothetical protein
VLALLIEPAPTGATVGQEVGEGTWPAQVGKVRTPFTMQALGLLPATLLM